MIKEGIDYKKHVPMVADCALEALRETVNIDDAVRRKNIFAGFLVGTHALRPAFDEKGIERIFSRFLDVVTGDGVTVIDTTELARGLVGQCSDNGFIELQVYRPLRVRLKALIHEYGHWILGHFGEKSITNEETQIQAEGISCVVTAYLGCDFGEDADYLIDNGARGLLPQNMPLIKATAADLIHRVKPWETEEGIFKCTDVRVFDYELELDDEFVDPSRGEPKKGSELETLVYEVLKAHPEGLGISEIAKLAKRPQLEISRLLRQRDRDKIVLVSRRGYNINSIFFKTREHFS